MTGRAPRVRFLLLLLLAGLSFLLPGCHRDRELLEDNEEIYRKAQEYLARRRFLEAIQVLGDAGMVTPVGRELDPEIKLALADAYYYQGGTVNVIEAQSRYEQFLSFYPLHPKASYARYMVGVCLFEQGEDPENDQDFSLKALRHFERMIRELPPDDPWVGPARVMYLRCQDRIAEHEWIIANFYWKGEHWMGAIRRLEGLVEKYPASRRREEALYRLAHGWEKVGNPEKAREMARKLVEEYPSGPFAAKVKTEGLLLSPVPASAGGDGAPAGPSSS